MPELSTELMTKIAVYTTETDVASQEKALEPPTKRRKLFTFMDEDKEKNVQSSNTDKQVELQKYLEEAHEEENKCPLNYWSIYLSILHLL